MVHYCEKKNHELKENINLAESLKATINAHEKERENAYEALGNLLGKETGFEKEMFKETSTMHKEISKNQSGGNIKVKQRMVNSDNEMRFASMMKYLDKYPEYQTKSSFRKIIENIEEKERSIRHAKEDYNKALAKYHELLQAFNIWVQKAKDKIEMYHLLLDEGQKKIDETRYKKGFIYKYLTGERKKQEVNLDTIKHRMPQFENTLKLIEGELSQYKGRKFVELEY
jgi:hypothetical protein